MNVNFPAFMGVALFILVTPGPDTALVTKNALIYGRRAGLATARAEARPGTRRLGAKRGFRLGLISNLANPKVAVLFTSLLPQFIGGGQRVLLPFLLLGGIFVAMTLTWMSGYALMAAKAGGLLTRPRVKAALDRITGLVLVGLGLRLATEQR